MRMKFCPECGVGAVMKDIGDEGMMPFCPDCRKPLWDSFRTCIIAAVVDEDGEFALLRQNYVSSEHYVCVAGVVKAGESAEDAALREVSEELGLAPVSVHFVRSYPYPEKDMLMLGFRVDVRKGGFRLSNEVDSAEWFMPDKALNALREGSIAYRLVRKILRSADPAADVSE